LNTRLSLKFYLNLRNFDQLSYAKISQGSGVLRRTAVGITGFLRESHIQSHQLKLRLDVLQILHEHRHNDIGACGRKGLPETGGCLLQPHFVILEILTLVDNWICFLI